MFEIIDLDKLKRTPIDLEGVIKQKGRSQALDQRQNTGMRENRPVSFSLKQLTHKLSNLGYEKDFVD